MASSRFLSALFSTALLLLLISNAEARCLNLSSLAPSHCSQHGGGALNAIKTVITPPYPIKALATGQTTPQEKIEDKHQAAAIKATAPSSNLPLQNDTGSSSPEDVKSLPTPTGTFVITAWGTGKQNYSCPGPASPSATPSLVGAVADLFDADQTSRPLIGHHFFNSAGNPTFDFTNGAMPTLGVLQTQKTKAGDIASPKKEAVDWLNLVSDGQGQGGLQEVYRVDTTGGKPAPGQCSDKAAGSIISVPYHAYYWFYS